MKARLILTVEIEVKPRKGQDAKELARLRLDAFNAFNHTQFSGYNATVNFRSLTDPTVTNLPYDANGNLIWAQRNGFGTVNGARDPRVLQMYLRLQF